MKGFLVTLVLVALGVFSSTTLEAQDCDRHIRGRKIITYKAVRPVEVLHGVSEFCKESACRTANGVGTILRGTRDVIEAPFRSEFKWPKARLYHWHRGYWHKGHWHQVRPPKIDLGEPVDREETQFIPVPYIEPELRGTIVLLERKF